MLIRRGSDLPAWEITDEKTYIARSEFIRRAAGAVLAVAAAPLLTVCADDAVADAEPAAAQTPLENVKPKVVHSRIMGHLSRRSIRRCIARYGHHGHWGD